MGISPSFSYRKAHFSPADVPAPRQKPPDMNQEVLVCRQSGCWGEKHVSVIRSRQHLLVGQQQQDGTGQRATQTGPVKRGVLAKIRIKRFRRQFVPVSTVLFLLQFALRQTGRNSVRSIGCLRQNGRMTNNTAKTRMTTERNSTRRCPARCSALPTASAPASCSRVFSV
jgi:hypothetical protein